MYIHYQQAILKYYKEKKANGDLSLNLQKPAPSKIRDECAFIFKSNLNRQDLSNLKSFLEIKEGADVLLSIEQYHIDKFRPVVKFMKGITSDTEHKNLELLALLLQFPGRPFDEKRNYETDFVDSVYPDSLVKDGGKGGERSRGEDLTAPIPENPATENSVDKDSVTWELQLPFTRAVRRVYDWLCRRRLGLRVGGIAALGLVTAIYFNNGQTADGGITPDRGCMMWTGDRFLQISCDSNIGRSIKEPLDKGRLQNLQRITTPDTLRKEHIKNVWYRKRDGEINFYTAGGADPFDPKGDLHPLTVYIYEKYVEKKVINPSNKKNSFLTN